MKKIRTVVKARPQFIKLARAPESCGENFKRCLSTQDSRQHYDHNTSDVFFEEMEIPMSNYNLGLSDKTHEQMSGQMLMKIKEAFLKK